MQVLDRTGVGTLWSICKEKFALTGHTHNYAGSGSPGGSANSAIGVVDCNGDIDDIIQIGYAPPVLGPTEILYIAGYTAGDNGAVAKIKNITKQNLTDWLELSDLAFSSSIDWSLISRVPTATTTQSGIMSAADKSKLNGIASGANNYSLPVASNTTLGGIKVSMPAYDVGTSWPINLDNNGVAYTSINGLNKNNLDGSVENVITKNNKYSTTYSSTKIQIRDMSQNKSALLDFPSKSGIFALLSDIPDASNLCRFNFINSISECKSDRINFLFKNDNSNVDLSHLYNFEDGAILFIYSPHFGYEITCKSDTWYYYGNSKGAGETDYVNSGILRLAFLYKGYVYLCSFNK